MLDLDREMATLPLARHVPAPSAEDVADRAEVEVATEPRILVVSDECRHAGRVASLLRHHGYANLATAGSLGRAGHTDPDLVVLDLTGTSRDQLATLERCAEACRAGVPAPVLALMPASPEARRAALALGARDCLTAPFDADEFLLRVARLVETHHLQRRLTAESRRLEDRLRDLERLEIESLERLARAVEFRDDETGTHTQRVAETAARLAGALGLPAEEVELIRLAAPLHDVGKVGIPDRILLKQGALTAEEFSEMQRHTVIGAQILGAGRSPVLQLAEQIALTHHERWDGAGYLRLEQQAIPLASRIVTVADVYDALTHTRPYKPAWSHDRAVDEIAAQSGQQFDPAVVDAFLDTVACVA